MPRACSASVRGRRRSGHVPRARLPRHRVPGRRDELTAVELVRGGEVLPLLLERSGMAVRFDQPVPIDRSTWLALRVSGHKLGETPFEPLDHPEPAWELGARIVDGARGVRDLREGLARARVRRPSALRTAPVWITVSGTSPIAATRAGADR